MKRTSHAIKTIVIMMVSVSLSFSQTIYYVDASQSNDSGAGTSWATAKRNLQPALDVASAGDEVRVAFGEYIPTEFPNTVNVDNPRNITFHLNKDIVLRGSFNPTTNTQDYNNPSILNGDINDDDVITGSGADLSITNKSENIYHVFITADLTESAIIDGFTIQGGNASGSGEIIFSDESIFRSHGGGMFNSEGSTPSISNMIFVGNSAVDGGGMFNASFNLNGFNITDITFIQNFASNLGGGMRNIGQFDLNLNNLTFIGNRANFRGGGMSNSTGIVSITNSTFDANSALAGGGIYSQAEGNDSIIKNCVFRDNTASDGPSSSGFSGNGGGIFMLESSLHVINTFFIRNISGKDGGAIHTLEGADPVDYINNIFVDNSAQLGGAIYQSGIFMDIINNVFVGNTADVGIGAVGIVASLGPASTKIINSTFIGNNVSQNGFVAIGGFRANSLTLDNNVFFGETGNEILLDDDTSFTSRNNFSENFTGTGFTTLTESPFINSEDPDGADDIFGTLDDGLFPAVNSPLIDAGANSRLPEDTYDLDNDTDTTEMIPFDIAGLQRIVQIWSENKVDVGAYEFNTILSTNFTDLKKLSIFPNPTKNIFQIRNPNNLIINSVRLLDLQGRMIKQFNLLDLDPHSTLSLDISKLTSAIYLLEINSENIKDIIRIVKE